VYTDHYMDSLAQPVRRRKPQTSSPNPASNTEPLSICYPNPVVSYSASTDLAREITETLRGLQKSDGLARLLITRVSHPAAEKGSKPRETVCAVVCAPPSSPLLSFFLTLGSFLSVSLARVSFFSNPGLLRTLRDVAIRPQVALSSFLMQPTSCSCVANLRVRRGSHTAESIVHRDPGIALVRAMCRETSGQLGAM